MEVSGLLLIERVILLRDFQLCKNNKLKLVILNYKLRHSSNRVEAAYPWNWRD